MTLNQRRWVVLVLVVALALAAAACGETGTAAGSRGSLSVGAVDTPKSVLLAQIYGQALAHDGYAITYELKIGNRDVVTPVLEVGLIDLYPGYAATELEYFNKGAKEATSDAAATTAKLNSAIQPFGLVALKPSPAVDQYAFAVTKATQTKYKLSTLSDLAAVVGGLTLSAWYDCGTSYYFA